MGKSHAGVVRQLELLLSESSAVVPPTAIWTVPAATMR